MDAIASMNSPCPTPHCGLVSQKKSGNHGKHGKGHLSSLKSHVTARRSRTRWMGSRAVAKQHVLVFLFFVLFWTLLSWFGICVTLLHCKWWQEWWNAVHWVWGKHQLFCCSQNFKKYVFFTNLTSGGGSTSQNFRRHWSTGDCNVEGVRREERLDVRIGYTFCRKSSGCWIHKDPWPHQWCSYQVSCADSQHP